jgi:AbrB family looped-hinge helix DNA binding protein
VSDTSVILVGPKGRVVIPAVVRRQLGILEGSELVVLVEGEAVVLVPRSAIKSRLRSMFADVGSSMGQELIVDRRAEAVRESRGGA